MRFIERTTAAAETTVADYALAPSGPISFVFTLTSGTDLGATRAAAIYYSLQRPENATQWLPLVGSIGFGTTVQQVPYTIQGMRFDVAVSSSGATPTVAWTVLQGDNS